jgi:AcrR family transcriptional regulator
MQLMATKPAAPDRRPARERLLAAAAELFYEEGVNTVGIDRVIERAGVAKASLYDCFGSKDELVRAYLTQRHEAREVRITERLKKYATPRERLLGVFDAMGDLFKETNYRGCAFIRASAEVRAGSSVKQVCDDSRAWLRALFVKLAKEAEIPNAEKLADQLLFVYDGAAVAAQMDRNTRVAAQARATAAVLIDAAAG